jgi:ubiquinone/menaquinone biosynthesis C-methylase UbiE
MLINDSDRTWEYYGRNDPYFGVLTDAHFRREELGVDSRNQFFDCGRRHVDSVLEAARRELDPEFRPSRALDFGCGVGRLAIPLGKLCDSVVGIDVADSMLEEARKNCRAHGLSNVTFVKSDDTLSQCEGPFDFVHSIIVFQHIPPGRGEAILGRLVELLRPGGIGALHFTYAFRAPRSRRLLLEAYRAVPLLYGLRNLAKRRPFSEPLMQMNEYDLNRLFAILQERGAHRVRVHFTRTCVFGHPFYGAVLLFQKAQEGTLG